MKTTAAAPSRALRRAPQVSAPAPQTLTLDMDLPPAPARRTRTPSGPAAPPAAVSPAVPVPLATVSPAPPAKPVARKAPASPAAAVKPAPAAKSLPAAKPKAPAAVKAPSTARPAAPASDTARVERAQALEGGSLWRMSGRHAVAYVHTSALACALLAVEPRHLAQHAMAVYYDKKGRAIAWQVRFDTQRWDDVLRRLG